MTLPSREPFVARLAAVINVDGLRLGAVGERIEQVEKLGGPCLAISLLTL